MTSRKVIWLICTLMISISVAMAQSSGIQGTWKLIAKKWNTQTKIFADADVYKIITDLHWVSIGLNPNTGELYWAIGGSYQYADNKYVEKIEFFNLDSSLVGNIHSFDMAIEKAVLCQKGILPSNQFDHQEIVEYYQRIEPAIHSAKQLNPLIGVWEIIEAQYGDKKSEARKKDGRTIKIITPSFFVSLSYNTGLQKFNGLAFGKQKVVGDTYFEQIKCFSWDPNNNKKELKFQWFLVDGQFIQQGRVDLAKFSDYLIYEKYNRLE